MSLEHMLTIPRVIPYREYTGYEIASILQLLPEWVAHGKSEPAIVLGKWIKPGVSLPKDQHIDDINIEYCKSKNFDIVYLNGGGRAFLNTGKELYFLVVGYNDSGMNIVEKYEQVAEKLIRALHKNGLDAHVSVRKAVLNENTLDAHDIVIGEPLRPREDKIAVLAGKNMSYETAPNQRTQVFFRHGSLFIEPYTDADIKDMIYMMNHPKNFDPQHALETIKRFPSYAREHNRALSHKIVADTIAHEFGQMHDWTASEWDMIRQHAQAYEEKAKKYDKEYFRTVNVNHANKRGLCMYEWGLVLDWKLNNNKP